MKDLSLGNDLSVGKQKSRIFISASVNLILLSYSLLLEYSNDAASRNDNTAVIGALVAYGFGPVGSLSDGPNEPEVVTAERNFHFSGKSGFLAGDRRRGPMSSPDEATMQTWWCYGSGMGGYRKHEYSW